MQGLKFRIQEPDGRLADLQVEGDSALIGSGAHCEIRLAPEHASIEHVALQVTSAGTFAEARSFQPQPMLNDAGFTRAPVASGSVIRVGGYRIWIETGELAADVAVAAKKQQQTSPVTLILAAVAVPVCGYILLMDDAATDDYAAPAAPALWAEPVQQCPQTSAPPALALARSQAILGDAKRERSPFHVQDGVAAVPIFESAAACFRVAGRPKTADAYLAEAVALRTEIGEDFRTHRMRLEHALSVDDWQMAQEEVQVLLAFTEGVQGNYVIWLSNLDRKLRIQYGGVAER